jgi:Fe-S oxidoreductase
VACFFAMIYTGFRQAAHHSRSSLPGDKPGRSLLLILWGVLFIVNTGTALRTQADVWAITDNGNEASVRMLGKILGKKVGARGWDKQVVKELFYYAYQCTECRRCSLFCPYGIDTAEITAIVRELLHEVGLGIHWIMDPVKNCSFTGNHLGIKPHSFVEIVEMLADDCETITGIRPKTPFNEKGHEILFITPSGDVFADPGIYTFMGYLMLFHELDLDYTFSTYASEGGNFGSFTTFNMAKKLNAKMYAEAERLGSKWILGGECGHMWRVINQYMDTYNGPSPSHMTTPVSPYTGTVFKNAASTKMVHIAEFTADLINHNKLNLDPSRNDHIITTFHDSCNPARAMGLLDEPRYVLNAVCNNFVEMPENTIREQTFCCGAGSGLNTEEIMLSTPPCRSTCWKTPSSPPWT